MCDLFVTSLHLSDYLSRDELRIECEWLGVRGAEFRGASAEFRGERVRVFPAAALMGCDVAGGEVGAGWEDAGGGVFEGVEGVGVEVIGVDAVEEVLCVFGKVVPVHGTHGERV